MRNMGLIRGASLENAVCFTRDGVMNPEGLRFADECCRHKALDLIGDLALLGKPLLGHVIAERAGHAMHAALVARIMSDPSLYEILTSTNWPAAWRRRWCRRSSAIWCARLLRLLQSSSWPRRSGRRHLRF
jgi:UDP-3-O-[3-hydroxymyristoyl] N-acetylglucosamine deacetylase